MEMRCHLRSAQRRHHQPAEEEEKKFPEVPQMGGDEWFVLLDPSETHSWGNSGSPRPPSKPPLR